MFKKQDVSALADAFRKSYNQSQEVIKEEKKQHKSGGKRASAQKSSYEKFLDKYNDLENEVDNFKASDLAYFFRQKAEEAGVKYVIANVKKDFGIFKTLLTKYSARDICLMTEFLFGCPERNYLSDVDKLSPNVLASRWCNTIYPDSIAWANDEYVPDTHIQNRPVREWNADSSDTDSEIGEW